VTPANIFTGLPGQLSEEQVEVLQESAGCRIERILSTGQVSPPGYWYDQPTEEWVLVLAGRGRLRFEENDNVVELGPGDYLHISAHTRHRVEWTDPEQRTLWLAVHW
jgi:cupin 2 domain-containing protein